MNDPLNVDVNLSEETSAQVSAAEKTESSNVIDPSQGNSEAPKESGGSNAEGQELRPIVEKLASELAQKQEELLRTMADFQNFRKRTQTEAAQLRKFATQSLVESLLPILDNFERTLRAAESGATMESLVGGVGAVERQLKSILEAQGLERIVSVGQPFDAEIHEALAVVATEDHEPDTVMDEIEAGYRMGDRIIRPAKVRVAGQP